jgi:heme exporter protein D
MDLEIFNLSGYGKFVWPAFFLTFSSCFLLFVKTKILSENYKQLKTITVQTAPKKNTKKILSGSSIL